MESVGTALLRHRDLKAVDINAMFAEHPWEPHRNHTPVAHVDGHKKSVFINANSRSETRNTLLPDGSTLRFHPNPVAPGDLEILHAFVGGTATMYVLYKGQGRRGTVEVTKRQGAFHLRILPATAPPAAAPAASGHVSWADMEDD